MLEVKREKGKIYSHIRERWLVETPEELVRQQFVCLLVNYFEYPFSVMREEYKTDHSGRGVRSTRADIVIFKSVEDKEKNHNAYVVIECKPETVKIMLDDFYQGTEYAGKTRAQFLILHNSKETNYYSVNLDIIPNNDDAFKQITTIPKFSEIGDAKKVEEIKNKAKAFTRREFTDLLLACHNIIRNNDKLSPEAAFDEISKILFIKINYERLEQGKMIFSLAEYLRRKGISEESDRINYRKGPPYMQTLFEQTKEHFHEDQLFEENDKINIRENSFEAILKKLEIYNLSDTSDDIKGIAFEEFLGKTFRGELGQFFTPRSVVDFMVEILEPEEGEILCDPTCGSGGFLIKSFDYIRHNIEQNIKAEKKRLRQAIEVGDNFDSIPEEEQIATQLKVENMHAKLNRELNHLAEGSRMFHLSHQCIFGTDANPRMARVSKMNMIMHGVGHGGVYHHDGLLNIHGVYEERFDVILTNPPFGARIDKHLRITDQEIADAKDFGQKHYKKNDGTNKTVLGVFDTGSMSALTEVLFMERCLRLLKKGGRMGLVLPEGVLNITHLQKVREYFEGKAKIILICSIPQDVFVAAGATVKASLVFFKRFTQEEEEQYAAVTRRAREEVRVSYEGEIFELTGELSMLNEKAKDKSRDKAEIRMKIREITKRLAAIENAIIEKAKPLVKEYFDYEIPIAMVEDAGITSTGAKSTNNQLTPLQKEFKEYRASNQLWQENHSIISYAIKENGKLYRLSNGEEVELKW